MDTHVAEGRDFRDSFSVELLSLLKQEIAWVWVALRNRLSPGPTGKPGLYHLAVVIQRAEPAPALRARLLCGCGALGACKEV